MSEYRLELCGLDDDAILVVGVSGGADSLALLHLLSQTRHPLLVSHFNHQLRPGAEDDAALVRRLAMEMGYPFYTDAADVALYAAQERFSVEEAARKLRYRFLFDIARQNGAQAVLTAHTADDQVETVLMHFLRGAGLAGLKGMPCRVILPDFDANIPLVRPLLHLWRSDTEAICRENELRFAVDPSNADTTYFRNSLRHKLIPELENYNPRFKQAILRSAQAMQGDFDLLNDAIDEAWEHAVMDQGDGFVAFDRVVVKIFPLAMRRNLFRRAAYQLNPRLRDVDFDALERAAALGNGITELAGGLRMYQEGQLIYLTDDQARLPPLYWPQVDREFDLVVGFWSLGSDWVLQVDEVDGEHLFVDACANDDPFIAWLDADVTGSSLRVRLFRAGDRLEPLGMPGKSAKLSDIFINLKIPKRLRASWPLVCADDAVAWVTGLRMGHAYRVTETTRRAWKLTLMKM